MVITNAQCKTRCENTQGLARSVGISQCGLRSGFLVLEVMVALLIMSAAALIVAWYQAHTCLLYADAMRSNQATFHASALIRRVEQGHERGSSGSLIKDGFSLSWRCESFQGLSRAVLARMGLEDKKMPLFVVVTAAVSWPGNDGQQRNVSLVRVVRVVDKKGGL